MQVALHVAPDIIGDAEPADRGKCRLLRADFLLNPANEYLVGTLFPYFPRGGYPAGSSSKSAAPTWQKSSNWCGMDAGENMLYPMSVMDGKVHQAAGAELSLYIRDSVPESNGMVKCPTGYAVVTPAFGLRKQYNRIIHAVPPFASDVDWEPKLISSYLESFRLACRGPAEESPISVDAVFLGTGARGISLDDGVRVAAQSLNDFADELGSKKLRLRFVVRDEIACAIAQQTFDEHLSAVPEELP
eukprot:gnl/TRDRNA2_/TRDRNA2_46399_c0_seq1.p1 gnl/TRDRNA2_/TRDRNA2_46399_c0~~gnl/TRDRNA2_/TRDRNA2_46399_c0_seq1.p1  ORF type:complete len:255 (+),score=35.79 gnl/TRDRNA2_/TRDRNA2_46399_c0_seq1:32-766(+)